MSAERDAYDLVRGQDNGRGNVSLLIRAQLFLIFVEMKFPEPGFENRVAKSLPNPLRVSGELANDRTANRLFCVCRTLVRRDAEERHCHEDR